MIKRRVEENTNILFSVYLAYYINFIITQLAPSNNIIVKHLILKYNTLRFKF